MNTLYLPSQSRKSMTFILICSLLFTHIAPVYAEDSKCTQIDSEDDMKIKDIKEDFAKDVQEDKNTDQFTLLHACSVDGVDWCSKVSTSSDVDDTMTDVSMHLDKVGMKNKDPRSTANTITMLAILTMMMEFLAMPLDCPANLKTVSGALMMATAMAFIAGNTAIQMEFQKALAEYENKVDEFAIDTQTNLEDDSQINDSLGYLLVVRNALPSLMKRLGDEEKLLYGVIAGLAGASAAAAAELACQTGSLGLCSAWVVAPCNNAGRAVRKQKQAADTAEKAKNMKSIDGVKAAKLQKDAAKYAKEAEHYAQKAAGGKFNLFNAKRLNSLAEMTGVAALKKKAASNLIEKVGKKGTNEGLVNVTKTLAKETADDALKFASEGAAEFASKKLITNGSLETATKKMVKEAGEKAKQKAADAGFNEAAQLAAKNAAEEAAQESVKKSVMKNIMSEASDKTGKKMQDALGNSVGTGLTHGDNLYKSTLKDFKSIADAWTPDKLLSNAVAKEAMEKAAEEAGEKAAKNAAENAIRKEVTDLASKQGDRFLDDATTAGIKGGAQSVDASIGALRKKMVADIMAEAAAKGIKDEAAKVARAAAEEAAEKMAKEASNRVYTQLAQQGTRNLTEKAGKEAADIAGTSFTKDAIAKEIQEIVAEAIVDQGSKEATETIAKMGADEVAKRALKNLAKKEGDELAAATVKEAGENIVAATLEKQIKDNLTKKLGHILDADSIAKLAKKQANEAVENAAEKAAAKLAREKALRNSLDSAKDVGTTKAVAATTVDAAGSATVDTAARTTVDAAADAGDRTVASAVVDGTANKAGQNAGGSAIKPSSPSGGSVRGKGASKAPPGPAANRVTGETLGNAVADSAKASAISFLKKAPLRASHAAMPHVEDAFIDYEGETERNRHAQEVIDRTELKALRDKMRASFTAKRKAQTIYDMSVQELANAIARNQRDPSKVNSDAIVTAREKLSGDEADFRQKEATYTADKKAYDTRKKELADTKKSAVEAEEENADEEEDDAFLWPSQHPQQERYSYSKSAEVNKGESEDRTCPYSQDKSLQQWQEYAQLLQNFKMGKRIDGQMLSRTFSSRLLRAFTSLNFLWPEAKAFVGDWSDDDLYKSLGIDTSNYGYMALILAVDIVVGEIISKFMSEPVGKMVITALGMGLVLNYLLNVLRPAKSKTKKRAETVCTIMKKLVIVENNNKPKTLVNEDHSTLVDKDKLVGQDKSRVIKNDKQREGGCMCLQAQGNLFGEEACAAIAQGTCNAVPNLPVTAFKGMEEFPSHINKAIKMTNETMSGNNQLTQGDAFGGLSGMQNAIMKRERLLDLINKKLAEDGKPPMDLRLNTNNLLGQIKAALIKQLPKNPNANQFNFAPPSILGDEGEVKAANAAATTSTGTNAGGGAAAGGAVGADAAGEGGETAEGEGEADPFADLAGDSAGLAHDENTAGPKEVDGVKEMDKYDIPNESVTKDTGVSIWKLISRRYIKSVDTLFK